MSDNDTTNIVAFKPKPKPKKTKWHRPKVTILSVYLPLRKEDQPINQNDLVAINGIIEHVSTTRNIHRKIIKRMVSVKMGVAHLQDLTVIQFDDAVKFLVTFCAKDKAPAQALQKGAKP